MSVSLYHFHVLLFFVLCIGDNLGQDGILNFTSSCPVCPECFNNSAFHLVMGTNTSVDTADDQCSTAQLLVSGYFKLISVHYGAGLVVPLDITLLCVKFYETIPLELCMLTNMIDRDYKKTKISNGIKCIDFNGRKIIRFSVYDINNTKRLCTTQEIWECMKGGICCAKNINLPSFITDKYKKLLKSFFDNDSKSKKSKSKKRKSRKKRQTIQKPVQIKNWSLFMKIGGNYPNYSLSGYEYTDQCLAVLYDSKQMDWLRLPTNGFQNIDTLQFQLPSLPHNCTANSLYNNRYKQLITIMDNYDASIYSLSFKQDEYIEDMTKDWKWKQMTTLRKNDNLSFHHPAMIFINDEQELMVCGGIEDNYQMTNIYNIETEKWIQLKSLNYNRCGSGIFYDKKFSGSVFVGGGLFSNENGKIKGTRIVEQYDFNKNEWYSLPQTNNEHNYFPPIWIDENLGKDLIFIAGFRPTDIGVIEFYDLRQGKKKWDIANKNVQHNIRNAIPKNAVIERILVL